ncbi:uncharacterized protein LOC130815779 [Amaranthus tricolor]|uniref:uncharacterized protein LOC130815779 n=1 Tax=Amaranthus tricolor TaxID=29722 RepID=UPI0025840C24|nr:uncharacterized protein LOC130815779 [Amaranthus tricolor]
MFIHLFICFLCLKYVSAGTNITTFKFLKDPETLVSSNAIFKIGFFSPGNSTNRYVGIWYNIEDSDKLEIVWVANKEKPINDSSGVLKISEEGNLQLLDGHNTIYWSANVSRQANISVAQLLDIGNLILLSSISKMIIWQSFDHLTDSLLPQRLSFHKNTDEIQLLRSWKSASDPSSGHFSLTLVPGTLLEFFTQYDGKPYWRSGPWDGNVFNGIPDQYARAGNGLRLMNDGYEGPVVLSFSTPNQSLMAHYVLNYDGNVFAKYWDDSIMKWSIWQSMRSDCEFYGKCGPFGTCNPNDSPICSCLKGFEPKNINEWNNRNWTSGCVRRTSLKCSDTEGKEDGFLRIKRVKVPDYATWLFANDEDDCRKKCLQNCSCLAFAFPSRIGCMVWNGSLIDIQEFSVDSADLFIRLANSELGETSKLKIFVAVLAVTFATFFVSMYYLWKRISRRKGMKAINKARQLLDYSVEEVVSKDLVLFKFKTLEGATSSFSVTNKLGQGGFGPVYKGKLEDGEEIAVKRLSRTSGQGIQEFMNELIVISKLQHKNLVRLLGCCVEQEERLLVYEYMPNKSLDALLFDPHHQNELDWKTRFNIINGVCRGLLYLHRDSRMKIIHRDLKASNILLDENLNPKISDFGMARIFVAEQDQANTGRVVGTYGYMSPEYAMQGRFSEKSDVFSFGVLLLETVSGRKNNSSVDNESLNLLSYAWNLWNANQTRAFVDPTVFDQCFQDEILMCIQLGLLCVQEFPEDRPTISGVISMLDADIVTDLPHPNRPGFTEREVYSTDRHPQNGQEHCTVNQLSLTVVSGRYSQIEHRCGTEVLKSTGSGEEKLTKSPPVRLYILNIDVLHIYFVLLKRLQADKKMDFHYFYTKGGRSHNTYLRKHNATLFVYIQIQTHPFCLQTFIHSLSVLHIDLHMYAFLLFLFCFPTFLQNFPTISIITKTNFLRDPDTLISNNTNFKLGFFSPTNSINRYVGIWYTIQDSDKLEVIWVANRDNPLKDTSGVLKISDDGKLQLLNAQNETFWSSSIAISEFNDPVAEILDTGNLVLLSNSSRSIIWQSFMHPTDSLVPPVQFTIRENMKNGPIFRSWKNVSNPSTGRFRAAIYLRNITEIFVWDGNKPYWRSGPWNGNILLGVVPYISMVSLNGFSIIENNLNTFYMSYYMPNGSLFEHIVINYDGNMVVKSMDSNNGKWVINWQSRLSDCDVFGNCGPFGSCNPRNVPICGCVKGFRPKNESEWRRGNWTNGCVRKTPLECSNGGGDKDGFERLQHRKVPDNAQWLTVDEDGCKRNCLEMCSCLAYSSYFGIGCMIWNESLIDIQEYPRSGADLFIRLATSELGQSRKRNIIVPVIIIIGTTIITAIFYFLWRWKSNKNGKRVTSKETFLHNIIEASGNEVEFQDCPLFEFEKLVVATNNFKEKNKLGQGGFGPVYKIRLNTLMRYVQGKLENGQNIAVKRLSRASGQGQQEFVNEVVVISKLQHKNLVKLLGCCIEGEEKLLIYELLPNKSLDAFLFDPLHRKFLDWKTRFEIIKGICRGVLYLHRDSRLKIIHRDLKASNVLLNEELNPKISDFGMARIFGGKQDQATTLRVVGTYGYMALEYAMEGRFSEKSDVYSLGVLLLEIVSGRRNGGIHDGSLSLLSHAWKLWNEDNIVSLIDPTIFDPNFKEEILRSIHVGLLCVQEYPEDRPCISTMINMLDTDLMVELPNPLCPGFTHSRKASVEVLQDQQQDCSVNLVSLSCVDGR